MIPWCAVVLGVNVFWLDHRLCTYLNQISPAQGMDWTEWCPGARTLEVMRERPCGHWLFYNIKHINHHSQTGESSGLCPGHHLSFSIKTFSLEVESGVETFQRCVDYDWLNFSSIDNGLMDVRKSPKLKSGSQMCWNVFQVKAGLVSWCHSLYLTWQFAITH